jgi:hypothetical protein
MENISARTSYFPRGIKEVTDERPHPGSTEFAAYHVFVSGRENDFAVQFDGDSSVIGDIAAIDRRPDRFNLSRAGCSGQDIFSFRSDSQRVVEVGIGLGWIGAGELACFRSRTQFLDAIELAVGLPADRAFAGLGWRTLSGNGKRVRSRE